jgi:ubiquinone biosynthesis protein COQ9
MKNVNAPRLAVLQAALPHIPFDGFTEETLSRAGKECRLSEDKLHELFPRGPHDLALAFPEWADAEMLKRLPPKKLAAMRVRDKVETAVWERLKVLTPHRAAFEASLKYFAKPPRNIHVPKIVWATADRIWRAAGDTATDYNHYTKRLLLSGVLASTSLYWLNDKSENFENTRAFLPAASKACSRSAARWAN